MQLRWIVKVLVIGLTLPLLSGCWSKVEVNDIAIVTSLGLDLTDKGNVALSLELAIPRMLGVMNQEGGKVEMKAGWVVTAEGPTILEANRLIQQKLPRKIVYYHSKVIVIGEKLARSGIIPVLDFFERYKQSLIRSHVVFTKGLAVDILKSKSSLEKLSSEVMREEAKSLLNVSVRLLQFLDMLMSKGDSPIAAEVQIMPAESAVINSEDKQPQTARSNLAIKGAAIFNKDKLEDWLTEKETRGLLWLRNRMTEGVLTINIPEQKGGGKISASVNKAHNKINPRLINNSVSIQIKQTADVSIFENSSKLDLGNLDDMSYIKELMNKEVNDKMMAIIHKAQQQLKRDIFGFGRVFYRQHPATWNATYAKNWDTLFPDMSIKIVPEVTVSQVGLTTKSIPFE